MQIVPNRWLLAFLTTYINGVFTYYCIMWFCMAIELCSLGVYCINCFDLIFIIIVHEYLVNKLNKLSNFTFIYRSKDPYPTHGLTTRTCLPYGRSRFESEHTSQYFSNFHAHFHYYNDEKHREETCIYF